MLNCRPGVGGWEHEKGDHGRLTEAMQLQTLCSMSSGQLEHHCLQSLIFPCEDGLKKLDFPMGRWWVSVHGHIVATLSYAQTTAYEP